MAYRESHRRGLLGRIQDIPDMDVVDMLERWGGLDIWLGQFDEPQKIPAEKVGIDFCQVDLVEILENKTRRNYAEESTRNPR